MTKYLLIYMVFLLLIPSRTMAQFEKYPKRLAIEELEGIKKAIVDYHPNPFRYISKEKWHESYQEAVSSLTDSIDMFKFISLASPLVSALRDEHSNIDPSNNIWNRICKRQLFFPFEVSITKDKTFKIRATADPSLDFWIDKEIKSINGKTTSDIIEILKICSGTSASSDYSGTLYHAFNYDNFGRKYFLCIDQSEQFEIQFKTNEKKTINGRLTKFDIGKARVLKLNPETAPEFQISQDSSLAYLRLSSFWPGAYNRSPKSTWEEFDEYFTRLRDHKVKRLVIDIRGNRGGAPFFSTFLAGYFFDQPYQSFDKITAKKLASDAFPKQFKGIRKPSQTLDPDIVVLSKRLKRFTTHHKKDLIFKKNVIVLVDSGTGSAATIFASLLKNKENVTYRGLETLGDATNTTGGQFKVFKLKHSNLELTIPLFLFHHGSNKPAYGIKPDSAEIDDSFLIKKIERL